MPYTSLRVLHPPLREVPPELVEQYRAMRRGRARFLLSLLMGQPTGVVIGQYRWRTGRVHLSPEACQFAESNGIPLPEVPHETMKVAVASLRIWLKQRGFPIGASQRCEAGVGCRGYRYTKEVEPFNVMLVDRRKRLRETPNGGGR